MSKRRGTSGTSGHFVPKSSPAPPGKPGRRLRFEDADKSDIPLDGAPGVSPPVEDAPATSGQNVPKSKKGGKLKQDKDKARPSDRLRREDEVPGGDAPGDGGGAPASDKKAARDKKRYEKSGRKADKSGAKLETTRDKLAAQKPPKKPGPVKQIGRAARTEVWAYTHKKIYQVEEENVGIKAAHRTELAGEAVIRGGARIIKHRIRTRPARRVRKWERKDIKARADHTFRTLAQEHPELKKNAVSRYMQKRRIKKQYQKQAREAAKKAAGKTASAVEKIGRAVVGFVKRHPTGVLIALCVFLLIIILQSCVASFVSIGNGAMGAIGGTSYLAEDEDINQAELAYTEWEADLTLEALNAESSRPGYDEYRFSIDPTGHDPHALLAFLTAKYDNFTFSGVEPVLRDIFNQQYSLTFTEIVEVRTRTETSESTDPVTGETTTDTYEVEYNYYILQVTLTARPFGDIIGPMLTTQDEQDRYFLYTLIKGNRQYVGSPFPYNWLPYVSSYYGYRVHPISGDKNYHTGADIALPVGTEIQAGGAGVVLEAANDSGGYGLTLLIDYGKGVTARYAHCDALLVSAGQTVTAGQAIAKVGNTGNSTGPHLHIEVIKDGRYLNPLYFVVIPFD